ncbi:hypothetical protein ACXO8X_02500 [Lactobacillus delbrueckii subsp. bulgaricus]|nr:hypothetical protein [Lactobacillus delbrueckii subsp. bulgaricus]
MTEFETQGETLPDFTDFIKEFNALKYGYSACLNKRGGVDIVVGNVINYDGELKASLLPRQSMWDFEKSTFSYKELLLMANLSATLLGLRGGINNDQENNHAEPQRS